MADEKNVFDEIKEVLDLINTTVSDPNFSTAVEAIQALPGLRDVYSAVLDGLKIVFDALAQALDETRGLLDDSNFSLVTDFASNTDKLLGAVSGLVTGDTADTLTEIKGKVATIGGMTQDVAETIAHIKTTIASIKSALGM